MIRLFRSVALGLCLMTGCDVQPEVSVPSPPSAPARNRRPVAAPQRVNDSPGLENVLHVSAGIFSGGEPRGKSGFASVAALEVKTIVSVDGARPNIELAHQAGLRYVHIPIGYDGVPRHAQLALVRLVRDADGPVYIHCHHGKHRGPAAAAIACVASGRTRGPEALAILELAGTGKEYAGLWRDVEQFSPPTGDADFPELVEVAQVDSLAVAMANVDRHWDNLKMCRDAGWQAPLDHPDLAPAQEALLVREGLHEARRQADSATFNEQFARWLEEAESLARQIQSDLTHQDYDEAHARLRELEQGCRRCHQTYRNSR